MKLLGGTEIEERNLEKEKVSARRNDIKAVSKIEENIKNKAMNKEQEEEKELKVEEIASAVKKLKLSKATGRDRIPMEVWKIGGTAVRRCLTDLIEQI